MQRSNERYWMVRGRPRFSLWSSRLGIACCLAWGLSVALVIAGCTGVSEAGAVAEDRLVISFTPEADPLHLELDAIGLAGFLAEELGMQVEAQVDADYAATVEAMAAGHAHIATNLAPLQAALAVERAGARLILAEEREGRAYYHSRLWVRKESGIERLEDLREKSIAFNDPLSGSGFLMPVDILIQSGQIQDGNEIYEFFDNIYFAGGTELSMRALINGDVDVAGVSENAAEIFLSVAERDLVTYIAESDPMPRHAIAVSGDLPPELVEQISQAFLKLNEPEYNELLSGLYGWRKVVPADAELYSPLLDKARAAGLLDE